MNKQLFLIDVGNSNIVFAGFQNQTKFFSARRNTRADWSLQNMQDTMDSILKDAKRNPEQLDGILISSVVPELNPILTSAVQRLSGKKAILADAKTIGLTAQSTVGVDRLLDGLAAYMLYGSPAGNESGGPILIYDLGTCTTLSIVDVRGNFLGGQIAAGIDLSLRAEAEFTAQLPRLQPEEAQELIGKDTVSCMLSGAVIGTAAMIEGIFDRISQESIAAGNGPATLVLTGGLSALVSPWIRCPHHIETDLLLKGLSLLFYRTVSLEQSAY